MFLFGDRGAASEEVEGKKGAVRVRYGCGIYGYGKREECQWGGHVSIKGMWLELDGNYALVFSTYCCCRCC